jgi:hypothetical protein
MRSRRKQCGDHRRKASAMALTRWILRCPRLHRSPQREGARQRAQSALFLEAIEWALSGPRGARRPGRGLRHTAPKTQPARKQAALVM